MYTWSIIICNTNNGIRLGIDQEEYAEGYFIEKDLFPTEMASNMCAEWAEKLGLKEFDNGEDILLEVLETKAFVK